MRHGISKISCGSVQGGMVTVRFILSVMQQPYSVIIVTLDYVNGIVSGAIVRYYYLKLRTGKS